MLRRSFSGFVLFALFLSAAVPQGGITESGILSIYFREQKVGYEEFAWTESAEGFRLQVRGRMTVPVAMEIESLVLRLSRDFIPRGFSFKGSLNGVEQEVESVINEGVVTNRIRVAGQEMKSSVIIRRDAFLLPNPVFSPYLVVAKKLRCLPRTQTEFSAYIIPQLEILGRLESAADNPCQLVLSLSGVEVTLTTDDRGRLLSLVIPVQHIHVVAGPAS